MEDFLEKIRKKLSVDNIFDLMKDGKLKDEIKDTLTADDDRNSNNTQDSNVVFKNMDSTNANANKMDPNTINLSKEPNTEESDKRDTNKTNDIKIESKNADAETKKEITGDGLRTNIAEEPIKKNTESKDLPNKKADDDNIHSFNVLQKQNINPNIENNDSRKNADDFMFYD